MPAPGLLSHGIELTERKSVQFENREILIPLPSDTDRSSEGSYDHEDASKSTNVDRHNMERMGKQSILPALDLY